MDSAGAQTADGQPHRAIVPAKRRRNKGELLADCCRTCRLRKVKCSGRIGNGSCNNCDRLGLECSFPAAEDVAITPISRPTPSHSYTEAGTPRIRALRACSQCHIAKTKCSNDFPRCKRCEETNLVCEYKANKRVFAREPPLQTVGDSGRTPISGSSSSPSDEAASSPAKMSDSSRYLEAEIVLTKGVTGGANLTAADMLLRRDTLLRHFDAYMDHMYWLPSHGFFHPKRVLSEIQDGTFNSVLAAGVCAVTACFIDPSPSGREFMTKCCRLVDLHLYQSVSTLSEELLVIYALTITSQLLRGEFAMVWQGYGLALRLMIGLRVNWDGIASHKCFFQQEVIRRAAWHFFYLDRMLAGGYDEYISCRADIMKIPLPCAEANFIEDQQVIAERLDEKPRPHPSTVNLHAYQIRLVDLRHRIQAFVKRLGTSSASSPQSSNASELMSDINALQLELTHYHMSLPPELLLTDKSVAKYMRRPERAGFVWLHSHLHLSHIDLYRFTLPRQRDVASTDILRRLPRDFLAQAQKQAVAHAMALGRFYDAIQTEVDQMPRTNRLELAGNYSIFQISTHCVRVLLIALQFGLYKDLSDIPTAAVWQKIRPDEAYIRHLIDAVQRVNLPWCDILNIARQAYDHNALILEEFNKTRQVANQTAAESMFVPKSANWNRLPGPDTILEGIANGGSESSPSQLSSRRASGSSPVSPADSDNNVNRAQAPGIPLFLAQARTTTLTAHSYDADNALLPMSELDSALPDL